MKFAKVGLRPTMKDVKTRLQTTAVWLFFYGLSLNLLLALAGISQHTSLQYNIGYDVHPIDLVIFTGQIDPILWLATTVETILAAIVLSAANAPRERVTWVMYIFGSVMPAAVFLTGRSVVAFAISILFTLSFLVSTTLIRKRLEMRIQPLGAFMTVTGFLALLILNESSALALRVVSVFFPNITKAFRFANTIGLQVQLSSFLFTFSPILMLAAIFVWIPVMAIILRMPRREVNGASLLKMRGDYSISARTGSLVLLGLAFVIGAFVALSPYANQARLRGVDTYFYYNYLSSGSSIADIMNQMMHKPEYQSRAPYLILLYLVKMLSGGDAFHAVIVTPAFLAAFFAATTYVLTKEFTNDWFAAGVAALLAASSFHITIGLFAGIFANWLALSVVMLFLYFLNRTFVKSSRMMLISTIASGYVIALFHPWTWMVMIAATFVAGLFTASFGRRWNDSNLRKSVEVYAFVLLICALPVLLIAFLALGTNALPSLKAGITYGLYDRVLQSMIFGLWYLGAFGPSRIFLTVSFTLTQYLSAFLAYPPILILSAVGAVSMIKINVRAAHVLASWLAVSSIITVLLDSWYQWRVLYLIPFEVLAAAGLLGLLQAVDWASTEYDVKSNHPRLVRNLKILLIVLILVDSVNYALKSAAILPFS